MTDINLTKNDFEFQAKTTKDDNVAFLVFDKFGGVLDAKGTKINGRTGVEITPTGYKVIINDPDKSYYKDAVRYQLFRFEPQTILIAEGKIGYEEKKAEQIVVKIEPTPKAK